MKFEGNLGRIVLPACLIRGHCAVCGARETSVCGSLDDRGLDELSALSQPHEAAPGESLYDEGDSADAYFNVTSGTVRVVKLLRDGRRQVLGFAGRGDFLGLAIKGEFVAGAEAVDRVRYCRLPLGPFRALLERRPALQRRLYQIVADDLAAQQDQLLMLGRKTARERVAFFLFKIAARGAKDAVELPMSRLDIADYLGLTIETVSRTFTQLRKAKIVALPKADRIVVLDPPRLEALAEGGSQN